MSIERFAYEQDSPHLEAKKDLWNMSNETLDTPNNPDTNNPEWEKNPSDFRRLHQRIADIRESEVRTQAWDPPPTQDQINIAFWVPSARESAESSQAQAAKAENAWNAIRA